MSNIVIMQIVVIITLFLSSYYAVQLCTYIAQRTVTQTTASQDVLDGLGEEQDGWAESQLPE